jgi:23S rRNA (cytidine1920-2'-O)/16S rRNA (cytidine1409-2'-O)-methyltransferase
VSGSVADKPSRLVDPSEPLELRGAPPRFVSRGGEKLDAALTAFDLDVHGRRCLDAGASTGGFTDCLLQRGATEVIAVDVGFGQLHERLRADRRVVNRERCNIRSLTPDEIGGAADVTVADLSFISLRTVLPALLALTSPEGTIVTLVKPQFEAGRQEASRSRGVIRDPAVWRRVLDEVCSAVVSGGATMMGAMVSPLRGADGNVEFLAVVVPRRLDGGVSAGELDALVASVGGEG